MPHWCMLQDMTYVKQLEAYEEEVMRKRLDEMPDTERERILQAVFLLFFTHSNY